MPCSLFLLAESIPFPKHNTTKDLSIGRQPECHWRKREACWAISYKESGWWHQGLHSSVTVHGELPKYYFRSRKMYVSIDQMTYLKSEGTAGTGIWTQIRLTQTLSLSVDCALLCRRTDSITGRCRGSFWWLGSYISLGLQVPDNVSALPATARSPSELGVTMGKFLSVAAMPEWIILPWLANTQLWTGEKTAVLLQATKALCPKGFVTLLPMNRLVFCC